MKHITFRNRTYEQIILAYSKLKTRYKLLYNRVVTFRLGKKAAGLYTGIFIVQ